MAVWSFGVGAGVHALVVGVGEYPWLVGGKNGPPFVDHEGMGQLTSAPESARAFARWIAQTYRSSTHPLRTLELLISEPQERDFEPTPGAGAKRPERATFASFKQAVLGWRNRQQATDRGVFYFCGHGLGAGFQHTLVLEDYGKDPNAAMAYAMDFTKFLVAMARSPALEQCYFLDACRVASGTLMQSLGVYGDPILTPSAQLPSPRRKQPVFYATMPGDAAYGRPGTTSLFTEGLLRAMNGAGAARAPGNRWEIRPTALQSGLEYHVDELARAFNATQNCLADGLQDFSIHELAAPPSVPVVLSCAAPIDVTVSAIHVAGPAANRDCPPPVPLPWRFELPPGMYDFVAVPPGGAPKAEHVFPPFAPVDLP